jgi:hypothetical protein
MIHNTEAIVQVTLVSVVLLAMIGQIIFNNTKG